MSRGASGFRTGAVYCIAANVVMFGAFLRIDSPTVCVATWWVVNFPSIPLLWALAQFFPPPADEPDLIRWDYCMWVAGRCLPPAFGESSARSSPA